MFEQAVILAGGQGTRLRPITYEISKQLIPVQGKPIMTWLVRWLSRYGVKRVLIITSVKWHSAYEEWRDALPKKEPQLTCAVDLWCEPEPMGTLGALVHHLVPMFDQRPFILTNGDELKGFSLDRLAEFHLAQCEQHDRYGATLALREVPNPSDYGVAEMEGDRIIRYHEKPASPPSNLVNSGLYVIEPSAFDVVDHAKKFLMMEMDLFPQLAAAGRLGGCVLEGQWFDCGNLARWETAIKEWKEVV